MSTHTYPLLGHLRELYAGVDLSNTLLVSSLHLLEPQKMLLENLGLQAIIAGKNYSTNDGVMRELEQAGHKVASFSNVFEPHQSFDDWYPENLSRFIVEELGKHNLGKYDNVIVLEDGGFLHLLLDKLIPDVSNFIGIEQTSSGHHRIMKANIRFPFISVAQSYHKLLLESPYIGELGVRRILQHLKKRGKRNPKILGLGLGPIGRQTMGRLLCVEGIEGCASDPKFSTTGLSHHGANDILRHRNKIISQEDALRRIGEFDVIVGSTGTALFGEEMTERLHPEVSLVSMSSSDREFPAVSFRKKGGGIHDDYMLGDRCLVNAGFPITFYGERNCIPPQQIELTLGLMMARLLNVVSPTHSLPLVIEQLVNMWRRMMERKNGMQKTFLNLPARTRNSSFAAGFLLYKTNASRAGGISISFLFNCCRQHHPCATMYF
jgi:hypothetical protein